MNPAKVARLKKVYEDWHWGSPAKKLIRVNDPLVPDVVGIGVLREFQLGPQRVALPIPAGCWIAFDPDHPCERLHIVLSPTFREEVRNTVKHAKLLMPLQKIAELTRGDQAGEPMPNLQAAPIEVLESVTYFTHKAGEEGNRAFDYQHDFGKEHSRGIKPILAADVSGRLWVCGGSYRCPLPGITG